jgi:hypothetical protein
LYIKLSERVRKYLGQLKAISAVSCVDHLFSQGQPYPFFTHAYRAPSRFVFLMVVCGLLASMIRKTLERKVGIGVFASNSMLKSQAMACIKKIKKIIGNRLLRR